MIQSMRKCCFQILLLPAFAFAQRPLQVTLDSITSSDSNSLHRKFTITYHVKNNTDEPLSFFLHPNTLIANAASSMTLYAVYKIYQNDAFQDMDGPFFPNIPEAIQFEDFPNHNSPEARDFIKKVTENHKAEYAALLENYRKKGGKSTDEKWIVRNQKLLLSKLTLQPAETKTFAIQTTWNRIRIVNNGDLEYYLNENDRFDFELVLDLKKALFKSDLSEPEFNQIKDDKHFIEGVFTSNKMPVNFGE